MRLQPAPNVRAEAEARTYCHSSNPQTAPIPWSRGALPVQSLRGGKGRSGSATEDERTTNRGVLATGCAQTPRLKADRAVVGSLGSRLWL